jgi:hypothetical protein
MTEKKNFNSQLKDFLKDNSYVDKYKKVKLQKDNYLIEIFRYRTKDGAVKGDENDNIPTILIQDPLNGEIKTNKDVAVDYTHLAKILVASETEEFYKTGDCVMLSPYETVSMVRNPDWIHYQEYQHSKGMEIIPPKDMREWIPGIQIRFLDSQFLLPEEYDKKIQDVNTFIIPKYKILSKWEL